MCGAVLTASPGDAPKPEFICLLRDLLRSSSLYRRLARADSDTSPASGQKLLEEEPSGGRKRLVGPGHQVPGPLQRERAVSPFLQRAGRQIVADGVSRDQRDPEADAHALHDGSVGPDGEDPG